MSLVDLQSPFFQVGFYQLTRIVVEAHMSQDSGSFCKTRVTGWVSSKNSTHSTCASNMTKRNNRLHKIRYWGVMLYTLIVSGDESFTNAHLPTETPWIITRIAMFISSIRLWRRYLSDTAPRAWVPVPSVRWWRETWCEDFSVWCENLNLKGLHPPI